MAQFIPRLTPPSTTDLHWIKTTHGGYNRCIVIDSITGSVLPNCTGYAWGRFLEENNITDCELSRGDAENWYGHNDSYERGQIAKLGAIICWSSSGGAGHVAVVEEIKSNGDIVTSNSAYNGRRFFTEELTRSSNYHRGSSYTFQGFIYPIIEFNPDEPTKRMNNTFPWVLYARKLRNHK